MPRVLAKAQSNRATVCVPTGQETGAEGEKNGDLEQSPSGSRVAVPVDRAYWTCYNFTKFANGQID